MGFYFRLAPGVRVRIMSRGVRTSVGPRAARVHFGAGGVGVSTGAGPVSFYSRVGGTSARRGRSRSTTTRSSSGRVPAQSTVSTTAQAKAAEAHSLQSRFVEIQTLNHVVIPHTQRPLAPPPSPVDPTPMLTARVASARSETSVFKFKERREALRHAHVMAQQDYQMAAAAAVEDMYQYQGQLDAWWTSLCAGEQDTVLAALAAAFEDNAVRAAAVGVDGRAASLVVVVPPVSDVPDRRPSTTASGNLSLKKLTKTETNQVYKTLVAGHVLLAVRKALATVPALTDVRIVAVRPGGHQAGSDGMT